MVHRYPFSIQPTYRASLGFVIILPLALSGCGGDSANGATEVLVYKATTSLQCGPNGTTQANLDATVTAVRTAGVTVSTASCGHTGNPSPAVCGIWNGDVWVLSVPEKSLSAAKVQGFGEATDLPNLKTLPCHAGGA